MSVGTTGATSDETTAQATGSALETNFGTVPTGAGVTTTVSVTSSGPVTTAAPVTTASSATITFVLTPVGQASETLLAQSVDVLNKRLADLPGSSAQAVDGTVEVTGPESSSEDIRSKLDSTQLNFRPVISVGLQAALNSPATSSSGVPESSTNPPTTSTSEPSDGTGEIPVQPSGADAAQWLKDAASNLASTSCEDLQPHDGPSDPERQLLTCDVAQFYLYLLDSAVIEGPEIESAEAVLGDQGAGWGVEMTLNEQGRQRWSAYTADNIGKQVAFVLDSEVVSAPTIQAEITTATTTITGGFTEADAEQLAAGLNTGALPLRFTITSG